MSVDGAGLALSVVLVCTCTPRWMPVIWAIKCVDADGFLFYLVEVEAREIGNQLNIDVTRSTLIAGRI